MRESLLILIVVIILIIVLSQTVGFPLWPVAVVLLLYILWTYGGLR